MNEMALHTSATSAAPVLIVQMMHPLVMQPLAMLKWFMCEWPTLE
jgi:hypothetical protein